MTVGELIDALREYPPDLPVYRGDDVFEIVSFDVFTHLGSDGNVDYVELW